MHFTSTTTQLYEHDTVVIGADLARNTDPPTLPTGKSQAQHNLTGIDITVIASKSEGCAIGFDKHFTGIPFEKLKSN